MSTTEPDVSLEDIERACKQLQQSPRGRLALRDLSAFFENGARMLDGQNRHAVKMIISGIWGGWASAGFEILKLEAGK